MHLRDVETLDDVCDVTAPAPVEPGDLVSTADTLYLVEVVLVSPPGARWVLVLAHRVPLTVVALSERRATATRLWRPDRRSG